MPAETTVQTTAADAPPDIQYLPSGEAWGRYRQFLVELILKHGCKSVCEIGGGANPWLPIEFVQEHGIDYLIVDISEEELAKADNRYRKLVLDITKPVQGELPACDFVFSRMLAEHVGDPLSFHRNIFNILKPGGLAFHYFPTLFAPPFVLNYLLPERLSYWLLEKVQSGRERGGKRSKFPAFYRWCRGPLRSQMARFQRLGYQIVHYHGFFGNEGYYKRFRPLAALDRWMTAYLCRNPWPLLTSYAYVVVKK